MLGPGGQSWERNAIAEDTASPKSCGDARQANDQMHVESPWYSTGIPDRGAGEALLRLGEAWWSPADAQELSQVRWLAARFVSSPFGNTTLHFWLWK